MGVSARTLGIRAKVGSLLERRRGDPHARRVRDDLDQRFLAAQAGLPERRNPQLGTPDEVPTVLETDA